MTTLTSHVQLRDGSRLEIRPMEADDGDRLVRFHHRLSDKTTYLRFFMIHPELHPDELERFTHVDHQSREAIVAVLDDEIAAVARFDRLDDGSEAEVAFVVADEFQGRGLGTALFQQLAERARSLGVGRFVAETLPHNHRMLSVFTHAGLPVSTRFEDGVVKVRLDLLG
ncbi:MAG: GNAT family N-acetyltransferase [Acidimicrobiales bacterium]